MAVQTVPAPKTDAPVAAPTETVLLVEGKPWACLQEPARAGLVRMLADLGCTVEATTEGLAALKAADAEAYLLILIAWPAAEGDGEGRSALRRLRRQGWGARVAIVTPGPSLEASVEALRLGAFDYLALPARAASVEALVQRARAHGDVRLRQLIQGLQIMTPGLAHELRNPLSGILASSQMLARLINASGPAREYVQLLQEEAQQLEHLLARLAEFGRLQPSGTRSVSDLDLHALLKHLLQDIRPACRARGIRQVTALDPKATLVQGDPARLAQAFTEILQNAVEAMPRGGTLTLRAYQQAASSKQRAADASALPAASCLLPAVVVEVADTGVGMSEEARRRACEPFFSTRPRRLGLGLALAQAIVMAHGGRLRLASASGKGSRVLLMLPAAAPGDSEQGPG